MTYGPLDVTIVFSSESGPALNLATARLSKQESYSNIYHSLGRREFKLALHVCDMLRP